MSGPRIMKFGGRNDVIVDSFDVFLSTIAKLGLISDNCSDISWRQAYDRWTEQFGETK